LSAKRFHRGIVCGANINRCELDYRHTFGRNTTIIESNGADVPRSPYFNRPRRNSISPNGSAISLNHAVPVRLGSRQTTVVPRVTTHRLSSPMGRYCYTADSTSRRRSSPASTHPALDRRKSDIWRSQPSHKHQYRNTSVCSVHRTDIAERGNCRWVYPAKKGGTLFLHMMGARFHGLCGGGFGWSLVWHIVGPTCLVARLPLDRAPVPFSRRNAVVNGRPIRFFIDNFPRGSAGVSRLRCGRTASGRNATKRRRPSVERGCRRTSDHANQDAAIADRQAAPRQGRATGSARGGRQRGAASERVLEKLDGAEHAQDRRGKLV
jgi:hypothetical protein